MSLQTIAFPDVAYLPQARGANWIQTYIFPGGLLPSLAQIERSLHGTRLLVRRVEDIAPSYVRTLATWRANFLGRLDEVRAMGFDERFIRMWDYYLSISEAGFDTGVCQDLQIVLEKGRGLAGSGCLARRRRSSPGIPRAASAAANPSRSSTVRYRAGGRSRQYRTGSRKSSRTPPLGVPPNVMSRWRTLIRTPSAVIARHGPSIDHRAQFETGVEMCDQPKCASMVSPRSTQAFSGRTPKSRRIEAVARLDEDRKPLGASPVIRRQRTGQAWIVPRRDLLPCPG